MTSGLYIEINALCILILAAMLFRLCTGNYVRKYQQYLALDLILFILFFAADDLWALIDSGNIVASIGVNYVINVFYFILIGLSGYVWLIYCGSLQDSVFIKNKSFLGILAVPFIILFIATVNSPFTGWVFYIDPDNTYHRGPLYFIYTAVTLGYILFSSAISLISATKRENIVNRALYLSMGIFPIFPTIAFILQILLPGYPLTAVGLTFPLFLVFINFLDSQSLTDEATLLYNRNWFYINHQSLYQKKNMLTSMAQDDNYAPIVSNQSLSSLYLVIMSIDNLSDINTKFGTLRGNEILCDISDILKWQSSKITELKYYQPIRLGNEEFLMICESDSVSTISNLSHSIQHDIKKYRISEDSGYSIRSYITYAEYPIDNRYPQDIVTELDEKLLIIKKSSMYTG